MTSAVEPVDSPALRNTARPVIHCLALWGLLMIGLAIWHGPGMADIGRGPQIFVELFVVALAFVPAVTRAIGRLLDRLHRWRMPWWLPIAMGIACSVYCGLTAWRQDRSFRTLWSDDSCYEIQARMMAQGRLWMPALPVSDSFDSPYLFVTPVYASIYFPGTALLLAPAVLAKLPIVTMPLIVTGAIAAMLSRIAGELIDAAAGLLAPLLWVSSIFARRFAIIPMSHSPVILLALVAIWAWLRWRGDPSHGLRWAVFGGVAVGWAAITRPLDAGCLLGPLLIVAAWELRAVSPMRRITLVVVALTTALPFLVLMGLHDWGVTGHWWQFPHETYVATKDPGLGFGFQTFDSTAEPQTIVPQTRLMYDLYIKKQLVIHTPANIWPEFWLMRLPRFLSQVLPAAFLIVLAVLGIADINSRALVVIVLPLFLLPVALAFYPWIPDHYPLVVWPATCVLIILGARQCGGLFPPARVALVSSATLLVAALALASLPEFDPSMHDDVDATHLQRIDQILDALPDRQALVLFHYSSSVSYFYEPVYNTDVAWPDDARVVRAHDLGTAQNAKLFAYYASIQPQRMVYVYDRLTDTLTRLGDVEALASRSASGT